MKRLYACMSLILSITVPLLAMTSPVKTIDRCQSSDALDTTILKYNDILTLLERIENEEFEAHQNFEELKRINRFLSRLANEGVAVNDAGQKQVLDQDVHMLFGMDGKNVPFDAQNFEIIPAVFREGEAEIVFCNWFSKQWRQTKHFVQKHKKALLIGAAVIVTITSVIYVASAVAAAKAAAAVAAGAQEAKPDTEGEVVENSRIKETEPAIDVSSLKETPNLAAVLQEGAANIQDFVNESDIQKYQNGDPALKERIREYSATIAHEIIDGLASLTESFPVLAEEIKEMGDRFFPELSAHPYASTESPLERFNTLVTQIHKKIDSAFSTNQSDHYLHKQSGIVLGVLPPPGAGGFLTDATLIASHQKFKQAEKLLKPYTNTFMSESQAKALIHKAGIETFPRPAGIPDNFRVRISDKGGGIFYCHPNHSQTTVRVMPGKPHSPLPCQQKPYVIHRRDRQYLDKFGNVVPEKSLEAHIPLEEFVFKE